MNLRTGVIGGEFYAGNQLYTKILCQRTGLFYTACGIVVRKGNGRKPRFFREFHQFFRCKGPV